jgi:hypothetical protein
MQRTLPKAAIEGQRKKTADEEPGGSGKAAKAIAE